MAIVRRFTPNAEDLLRYSYETGEKTGSKDNTLTTLKGRQVQGAQAQEAAIAAAQFGQRNLDRATALQQQREENQARLAANAQDNAVALEQTAARSTAVKDGREHDLTKIGMTADLAARNASLKATGGLQIPNAADGPIQSYDHALDNQRLFQTATSQERDALQKKFQAGDVNAIRAAIDSGRASLSQQDQQAYNQAEANLARASTDNSLHGPQKAKVQQEQEAIKEGIMRRAKWKPDDQQPKSLQEQTQERVVLIKDPTSEGTLIPAYIDPKTGKPTPLHEMIKKPEVDPNAPKPPKVLSEDEKRAAFAKRYDASYKALQVNTEDGVKNPTSDEVEAHMKTVNEAYDRLNGTPKPEASPAGASINEILGIPTEAPTTANTKAAPAADKKTIPFGNQQLPVIDHFVDDAGNLTPIVEIPDGRGGKAKAYWDGSGFMLADPGGSSMMTGEVYPPKDGKGEPTAHSSIDGTTGPLSEQAKKRSSFGDKTAPAPAPKKLPPVKVGNEEYAPVGEMSQGGKTYPIISMTMPGTDRPQNIVVKDGRYIALDVGSDGKVVESMEFFMPKFDSYKRPTAAPKEAVYVHSNDAASAKRAFDKGLTVYDEHGKVFRKK